MTGFVSGVELHAAVPDEPEWVWDGYLARGAVTIIAGKPKVGKTTLIGDLVAAVVSDADSFLGRVIRGAVVVYVSEESAGTLKGKLPASERLRVLTRDAAWPKPSWTDLLGSAVEEAHRSGAALLVIDTFSFWAALGAEREKDAGAVGGAMAALVAATRSGLAVALVHHQRKAGGEDGDAIRGSTALAGAADALVEVERPKDAPHGQRQILAVGRWTKTPPLLLVERDAARGAWRVVGEGAGREDASAVAWRGRLLRALPPESPGASYDEIAGLVGVTKAKWLTALTALVEEGAVLRAGEGRRGKPRRFWLASPVSVPGFHNPGVTENGDEGTASAFPDAIPPTGVDGEYGNAEAVTGLHTGDRLTDDELTALAEEYEARYRGEGS